MCACIDMPDRAAEQFDSEALWAVVAQRVQPGYRVLIVRGSGSSGDGASGVAGSDKAADGVGRDWFAEQVRAAGGSVEFVVSYQRRPTRTCRTPTVPWCAKPRPTVPCGCSAARRPSVIWVATCADQSWTQAKAVVTHSRIAQAARKAGFSVVCESRPTLGRFDGVYRIGGMNTEPSLPAASAPSEGAPAPAPGQTKSMAMRLQWVIAFVAGVALVFSALLWQKLGNIQEQLARQSADAGSQAVEARATARQAQELAMETAAKLAVAEARLSEVFPATQPARRADAKPVALT